MIKGVLTLGDKLKTEIFGNNVHYMVCNINERYSLIIIKDTITNNSGMLSAQKSLTNSLYLVDLTISVNNHEFKFTRVH